jgi:hypothetical protein
LSPALDVAIGLTSTQQLNQSSKCSFDLQLHSISWSFEALEADPCQLLRTASKANLRAGQRLRQIHRLVLRAHYQLMLPLHDKQEVYHQLTARWTRQLPIKFLHSPFSTLHPASNILIQQTTTRFLGFFFSTNLKQKGNIIHLWLQSQHKMSISHLPASK